VREGSIRRDQCWHVLDDHGVKEECINCGGGGELTDAGDNYIRVVYSVKGIGFVSMGLWFHLKLQRFTFDRVQGNVKQLDKSLPMRIPCI